MLIGVSSVCPSMEMWKASKADNFECGGHIAQNGLSGATECRQSAAEKGGIADPQCRDALAGVGGYGGALRSQAFDHGRQRMGDGRRDRVKDRRGEKTRGGRTTGSRDSYRHLGGARQGSHPPRDFESSFDHCLDAWRKGSSVSIPARDGGSTSRTRATSLLSGGGSSASTIRIGTGNGARSPKITSVGDARATGVTGVSHRGLIACPHHQNDDEQAEQERDRVSVSNEPVVGVMDRLPTKARTRAHNPVTPRRPG